MADSKTRAYRPKPCSFVENVAPSIWRIVLPTPFPIGPVNVYLLEGEPLTLIDTGLHWDESWQVLARGLRKIGYVPADLEQILLTHGHLDHFGYAQALQDASKARVRCHPHERLRVSTSDHGMEIFPYFAAFMGKCGFTEGEQSVWHERFHRANRFMRPVAEVSTIVQDDVVQAGKHEYQVIMGDGHARGQVNFVAKDRSHAFVGDFLLPGITPNPLIDFVPETGERFLALPAHLDNLDKVEDQDWGRIYPGHGEPQFGHRDLVRRNRRHHKMRCKMIYDYLAKEPQTVRAVSEFVFPGRPFSDTLLTVSDTIGHIDVLRKEKSVAFEEQDGLWYITCKGND